MKEGFESWLLGIYFLNSKAIQVPAKNKFASSWQKPSPFLNCLATMLYFSYSQHVPTN